MRTNSIIRASLVSAAAFAASADVGSPKVLMTRNPDSQLLSSRKKPPKTGLLM
jgi:hypothetical protein